VSVKPLPRANIDACFTYLRLTNDVEKLHSKYVRHLARQRVRTEGTAAGSAPPLLSPPVESPVGSANGLKVKEQSGPGGVSERRSASLPTVMDTLRVFFSVYPHHDEDETFPNMTSFSSALFSQCCANLLNFTSAAAARSLERAALTDKKATNSTAGAEASNKSRGRPPKGSSSTDLKQAGRSSGVAARRFPSRPNRWPANLPTIQHNLYWISHNNQPCLCTGLHFPGKGGAEAKLTVINIHPEARRMIIAPREVEPFHDDLLRLAVDDKTAAFAAAMADLCEWEMEHHVPLNSLLRRWYVYPEFVIRLLVQNSRWTGWRKSVERSPRAATMSRRENYFTALVEEYEQMSEQERNERFNLSGYPWDDTPLSEGESSDEEGSSSDHSATASGIESYGDRDDCSDEDCAFNNVSRNPAKVTATATAEDSDLTDALFSSAAFGGNAGLAGKKRGRLSLPQDGGAQSSAKPSKSSRASSAPSEDGAGGKSTHIKSLYNLFWIGRSHLPCLYFDLPENRFNQKFLVIPICCVTYHYPFTVTSGMRGPGGIEPLKMNHLKLITDERTSEFTYALLEFAQQESEKQRRSKLQAAMLGAQDGAINGVMYEGTGTEDGTEDNSLMDAGIVQPNELFDWPAFITDLVNQPTKWHSWRKKAERAGPGLKRHQYLRQLQSDWKEACAAQQLEREELQRQAARVADAVRGTPGARTLQIHSYYNLFWLLRSNLPAIYYDRPECRFEDKFTVLPINCCQYQYPTRIANSTVVIEPLSLTNLADCTEERTHDFTLALIDFAKWEQDTRRALASQTSDGYFSEPKDARGTEGAILSTESAASASTDESNELYDWPEFILHMINSPEEWSTWRKKAERSSGRESKRTVYFRALLEDYKALQAAGTGLSEATSTHQEPGRGNVNSAK
jgi:hypothetical protein